MHLLNAPAVSDRAANVTRPGRGRVWKDRPTTEAWHVPAVDLPLGSMYHVVDQVGARNLWERGITGTGVNVALIDTGVSPVAELRTNLRVAVDLTADQRRPQATYVDHFGHGTHLAGIIAGATPGADPARSATRPDWFLGVAPGAGLVSVKVAGRDGSVEPAALLAGIDWVIDHAEDLDIGVLAVAIDTGSASPYRVDPIAAALERAWAAGIVVVTAAGNRGPDALGVSSPAHDPLVIAVGGVEATDDGFVVPDWASRGSAERHPDLAAPGSHIVSLRAPSSTADVEHPSARVADIGFLGSGSSQGAAVVAGVAALLLSADPTLTPDQVKAALVSSARSLDAGSDFVGAGLVSADTAMTFAADLSPDAARQSWAPSTALTVRAGTPIAASAVWAGNAWAGNAWAGNAWAGNAWAGNAWAGNAWAGNAWAGNAWAGNAWAGNAWAGNAWAGNAWAGNAWAGNAWAGNAWAGNAWAGNAWAGNAWAGNAWAGNAWAGNAWAGNAWAGNAWA